MTQVDLVAQVAEKAGISKSAAQSATKAVFDTVADAVAGGDTVIVRDFGTFSAAQHGERTGRNVQTGEPIKIPARKAPKFKAAKSLRDRLAQG